MWMGWQCGYVCVCVGMWVCVGMCVCVCVGVIGYKRSKIVDLVWGNIAHVHTHPPPTPDTHNS